MAKKYTVKSGDSLWQIAKDNNMSLDELIRLNPTKKNMIHPNDVLRLEPDKVTERVNVRDEWRREDKLNLQNVTAIQGYKHDGNYVIIDKKNRKFNIYDKNNNLLYSTSDFSTGISGNDYNTITYVNDDGSIRNNAGNNSTPAGISEISLKGTYHGYPSFIRSRINKDGSKENIASSFHHGVIGAEKNASNGCVRIGGKTLQEIEPLLSTGTRIYTLPEKGGSKFTLKGGKLNFTADNPYGTDEGDKRFWDDYNVNIDKSYSPLQLKWKKTGDNVYDYNRKQFAKSIVNNKKYLQKFFDLSSDEYNHLAELALGIAEQESKFGTALTYYRNTAAPDFLVDAVKFITRGHVGARSYGYTQMKYKSDNKELQDIYRAFGVNEESLKGGNKAAVGTMAKLAYMYKNEVKGRDFIMADGSRLNPYDALLYKWMGYNSEITNKTATPDKNAYIRNVNKYKQNFDLYDTRTRDVYTCGGKISLQDIE